MDRANESVETVLRSQLRISETKIASLKTMISDVLLSLAHGQPYDFSKEQSLNLSVLQSTYDYILKSLSMQNEKVLDGLLPFGEDIVSENIRACENEIEQILTGRSASDIGVQKELIRELTRSKMSYKNKFDCLKSELKSLEKELGVKRSFVVTEEKPQWKDSSAIKATAFNDDHGDCSQETIREIFQRAKILKQKQIEEQSIRNESEMEILDVMIDGSLLDHSHQNFGSFRDSKFLT